MNNSNESVHNGQFGNEEHTENTNQEDTENLKDSKNTPIGEPKKKQELQMYEKANDPGGREDQNNPEKVPDPATADQDNKEKAVPSETGVEGITGPGKEQEEHQTVANEPDDKEMAEEEKHSDKETDSEDDDSRDTEETDKGPDYSTYSKAQLLEELKKLNNTGDIIHIKNEINTLKNVFYKKHNEEIQQNKDNFVNEGGKEEDYTPTEDPVEIQFKAELERYQALKSAYNKKLDEVKQGNLEEKYKIIEGIKNLVNSQESINDTFQEFRELQRKWRETGIVPQQELKNLWESYNHHVEKFYDYIKINKELRDLDFKKNLEAKIKLCEKAEELLLESNIVKAFRQLQEYHDQWREIGPVPKENRKELWERFKAATSTINKKHHEYFENLKKEQKQNLEKKTVLCEKAEAIAEQVPFDSHKNWEKYSKEIIELQRVWKTIGFAPKKNNTKIYQRFREACDTFFDAKREYYNQNKEEQLNNLQKKTDLCVQAESLKDSTDWKRTTDELIQLQKKWKEIGPVPRKNSDEVWKRFRAACDEFFNRKTNHFGNKDNEYEENLKKKRAIIEKIENFEPGSNVQEDIDTLKAFQRDWAQIGFVPYKEKDKIQEQYRLALNKHFDNLKVDDERKGLIKYKAKLETIAGKPRPALKLKQEREKFFNKLKQLENDITLWENNIGFFSSSGSANDMRKDFEEKIEQGKQKLQVLEEKIRTVDDILDNIEDGE